jgi:hypothetical protein
MPIFAYPDDPVWDEETRAVRFTVEVGEYRGQVTIPRTVFQQFLPTPTGESCCMAFYQNRAQFEQLVERKIERRDLTDDGNIEIRTRDFILHRTNDPH